MTPRGTRRLLDVRGEKMEIKGEVPLPIAIIDVPVWTTCVVTDKLPMPVIIGRPFMTYTNARMDFGQKVLQLNDCIASISFPKVSATPITDNVIVLHPSDDVTIPANSVSLVQCGLVVHKPLLGNEEHCETDLDILNVQKTDLILGKTVLIIKPMTVYHQPNGSYSVPVVNPMSHEAHLGKTQ